MAPKPPGSPLAARSSARSAPHLERISEVTGVPLAMVGTGSARDATIMIKNPFLS
jgi:adenylosuccinate synthase